jgi:hypothetical protein
MDIARWWAMVYFTRAMAHREAPFLDDLYAEIIINLWKAAEAILDTWKVKEVEEAAKKLGLTDEVAAELKRLCQQRHSDDVAHAVIYRKKSLEQFKHFTLNEPTKFDGPSTWCVPPEFLLAAIGPSW